MVTTQLLHFTSRYSFLEKEKAKCIVNIAMLWNSILISILIICVWSADNYTILKLCITHDPLPACPTIHYKVEKMSMARMHPQH